MQKQFKVLFSAKTIAERVQQLAEKIIDKSNDFDTIVPMLNGAMVFTSDLMRCLPSGLSLEPLRVSFYKGEKTPKNNFPQILDDGNLRKFDGRSILLVDTVFDSGLSMEAAVSYLQYAGANVQTCVLLNKYRKRSHSLSPDFFGWTIADVFVAGYGMDYEGQLRGHRDIITLE